MSEKEKIERATDAHTDKGAEEAAAGGQQHPASDPSQDETAGGSEAGSPQLGSKGKGGKKTGDKATTPEAPKTDPPRPKKVRVIVEKGTLGPDLLVFGDVTDNPEYVALLEIKGQKKVEAVR